MKSTANSLRISRACPKSNSRGKRASGIAYGSIPTAITPSTPRRYGTGGNGQSDRGSSDCAPPTLLPRRCLFVFRSWFVARRGACAQVFHQRLEIRVGDWVGQADGAAAAAILDRDRILPVIGGAFGQCAATGGLLKDARRIDEPVQTICPRPRPIVCTGSSMRRADRRYRSRAACSGRGN